MVQVIDATDGGLYSLIADGAERHQPLEPFGLSFKTTAKTEAVLFQDRAALVQ